MEDGNVRRAKITERADPEWVAEIEASRAAHRAKEASRTGDGLAHGEDKDGNKVRTKIGEHGWGAGTAIIQPSRLYTAAMREADEAAKEGI